MKKGILLGILFASLFISGCEKEASSSFNQSTNLFSSIVSENSSSINQENSSSLTNNSSSENNSSSDGLNISSNLGTLGDDGYGPLH